MVVDSGSSWSQPHRWTWTKINVVNMDGKKAQKKFHVQEGCIPTLTVPKLYQMVPA